MSRDQVTNNCPKLSVAVCCYDHGSMVAKAVDSVLAQQTPWSVEIVIADDASKDGTQATLKELAAQHDSIRLLLREVNVGAGDNFADLYAACRGEFIALLDGDDYWTMPDKLARQVAALEANPGWSMCFHRVEHVDVNGNLLGIVFPDQSPPQRDLVSLLNRNFIQTCSIVLRRNVLPELPETFRTFQLGDWPLCMLLAERGELGFLPEVMAAYRVHAGGTWSSRSLVDRECKTLEMLLAMQDLVMPHHVALVRQQIHQMFAKYGGYYEWGLLYEQDKNIQESLSWKITRPLRDISEFVRGLWK